MNTDTHQRVAILQAQGIVESEATVPGSMFNNPGQRAQCPDRSYTGTRRTRGGEPPQVNRPRKRPRTDQAMPRPLKSGSDDILLTSGVQHEPDVKPVVVKHEGDGGDEVEVLECIRSSRWARIHEDKKRGLVSRIMPVAPPATCVETSTVDGWTSNRKDRNGRSIQRTSMVSCFLGRSRPADGLRVDEIDYSSICAVRIDIRTRTSCSVPFGRLQGN